MDTISNSIIISVTKPRSIVILVSISVTLLRFIYHQLATFSSLLLLVNKYSNSIIIFTNPYPYIAVIS